MALTEDGKLFGWGYSADGRLGLNGKDLELSPMNPIAEKELSSLKLEVTEKLVLKGIEMEKNMPIIWEPHLIEEVHGVGIVDVACGLDHSLVLCSKRFFQSINLKYAFIPILVVLFQVMATY